MKRKIGWLGFAMTLALSVSGRAQDTDRTEGWTEGRHDVASVIEAWPENTKITANGLIGKYGPPDTATNQRLIWNNEGQWSQVTLFREGVSDDFPTTHRNVVENTIHYDVPKDKAGELTKFNSALVVNKMTGTLSVRSDSEQANTLALNLADEIVRGKREVRAARDFMRDTLRKSMAGKSSPYTDHLLFPVEEQRGEEQRVD